jgi:copper chaperone CopZ
VRKLFLILLLSVGTTFANGVFDPDIEIKVKGLVCPSCAIGIKNGLKKTKLTKIIKFDTKKQVVLVEYFSIEIHPSKIKQIIKNAGYEVNSIKWLKKKQPNRYNKP